MTQPAPSSTLQAQPPPQKGLAPIRQDLRLIPSAPEKDGSPAWALYDPMQNRYFRMGQRAVAVLNQWGADPTAQGLAQKLQNEGVDIDPAEICEFEAFLQKNNLTRAAIPDDTLRLAASAKEGRQTSALKWLLKNYLYIRLPLFRPDRFLDATLAWVSFLFSPWAWRIIVALGLCGLLLVMRQWEDFIGSFGYFFSPEGLAVFGLTLVAVKGLHELGHAYSAKMQGCRVPTMGVAFLVLYPMLYTDTTDAWRLASHRQRLKIALAGIRVELALAMLATFAWNFLPDGLFRSAVFFVATVSWVSSLTLNLSPFMRFDGYYALADWLGAENLQSRAFALAKWQLREQVLGLGAPPPETLPQKRKRIFILYAWGTMAYRFFLFLGIALLVYHAVFKVLGVVLFAVEIGWFIVLPIWGEIRVWWRHRNQIRLSLRPLLALATLGTALAVFFIPWQSETALVGLFKADRYTRVYPWESGRVAAVLVETGQKVSRGQPLIRLASPDLVERRSLLTVRIRLLRTLMDRHLASSRDLSRLPVLQRQMAEALSDLDGLKQRMARLVIRAPLAGKIAFLENLYPGQWLSPETSVVELAPGNRPRIEAYVAEDELYRIVSGATGGFFAGDGLHPWIPATVVDVEFAAVETLKEPMLASLYGGPIAARKLDSGVLRPEKALYRVLLETTQPLPPPPWPTLGAVRLKGRSDSLAGRFWRYAASVVIREAGI